MSSLTNSIVLVLVNAMMMVATVKAEGCFQNAGIFKQYARYIQSLSLDDRIYYSPGTFEDPKKMTAENEINLPKYWKKTYTCLEEYAGNRMLVEVVNEKKHKTHYQCLQFKSVTDNIIRQAKTKLRSAREKVNCEKDKYLTDEALLVAWELLQPQPCPITGGYQMILHEGEVIKGHCLDTILSYNPSLRFQCDGHNVIADFGTSCQPPILEEYQKMRRRQVAHLSCVGNWSESGDVKSVMLQMRDMPYDFWCIHYKRINETNMLSVFLTLDGRCVEDSFHDESFPRRTSLFGQLASYVPANDPRCLNTQQHDSCTDNANKCFESDQCPGNCKRCNSEPVKSPCRFTEDAHGHWQTSDSRVDMTVDVTADTLDVSRYGKFSCRDEADPNLTGRVYPVVQHDAESTCMPYYACASVVSPAPGVLNFKLQPASRNQDTGLPLSCKETNDKIGFVTAVDDEKMLTMVNFEKLQKSSCGFETVGNFSLSIEGCYLIVEKCGSGCSDLNIHYDTGACGDHMTMGFEIETDHVCYGQFDFSEAFKGLLTYSEFSERYFCWIYNNEIGILFIASPSACNPEGVKRIFSSDPREASVTYDPAERLMKPMSSGRTDTAPVKTPGGDGIQHISSVRFVLFSLCLLVFFGF